jgi:hypothetical protein
MPKQHPCANTMCRKFAAQPNKLCPDCQERADREKMPVFIEKKTNKFPWEQRNKKPRFKTG